MANLRRVFAEQGQLVLVSQGLKVVVGAEEEDVFLDDSVDKLHKVEGRVLVAAAGHVRPLGGNGRPEHPLPESLVLHGERVGLLALVVHHDHEFDVLHLFLGEAEPRLGPWHADDGALLCSEGPLTWSHCEISVVGFMNCYASQEKNIYNKKSILAKSAKTD